MHLLQRRAMRGRIALPALALVAIASPSLYADIYVHRLVKSKAKTIRVAVLLPPTTDAPGRRSISWSWSKLGPSVVQHAATAEETQKAEALASEIAGVVSNAFRKRGWEIDDNAFSGQALQNNEKLKNLVDYMRARYETLVPQMILRPKDVSRGRYSLGEELADLNVPVPADVLVLVYGSSEWLQKGGVFHPIKNIHEARAAPPILGGRGQAKYTFLHISLVDPRTGTILCYLQVPGAVEDKVLAELGKIP